MEDDKKEPISGPAKLYRSRQEKIIAGVGGGLAKYFNTDPTLVRIGILVLAFLNGLGGLLYIALWVLVPEDPNEVIVVKEQPDRFKDVAANFEGKVQEVAHNLRKRGEGFSHRRNVFGLVLVLIGLAILSGHSYGWLFHSEMFWPIVLILLGLFIVLRGRRE
jgi:phage shock protein C